MAKPAQSTVAQQLRSRLQDKIFLRYKKWHHWDTQQECWAVLPTSELRRKFQQYLDQHPDFSEGYSAGYVAAVDRLLQNYLTFNCDLYGYNRSNRDLLKQRGEVVR